MQTQGEGRNGPCPSPRDARVSYQLPRLGPLPECWTSTLSLSSPSPSLSLPPSLSSSSSSMRPASTRARFPPCACGFLARGWPGYPGYDIAGADSPGDVVVAPGADLPPRPAGEAAVKQRIEDRRTRGKFSSRIPWSMLDELDSEKKKLDSEKKQQELFLRRQERKLRWDA